MSTRIRALLFLCLGLQRRSTAKRQTLDDCCRLLDLKLSDDKIMTLIGQLIVEDHFEHIDRMMREDGEDHGRMIRLRQSATDFHIRRALLDHSQNWPSSFPQVKGRYVAIALARNCNWLMQYSQGEEVTWLKQFTERWGCAKDIHKITIIQAADRGFTSEPNTFTQLRPYHNLRTIAIGIGEWSPLYERDESTGAYSHTGPVEALRRLGLEIHVLSAFKELRSIQFIITKAEQGHLLGLAPVVDLKLWVVQVAKHLKQQLVSQRLSRVHILVDYNTNCNVKGDPMVEEME